MLSCIPVSSVSSRVHLAKPFVFSLTFSAKGTRSLQTLLAWSMQGIEHCTEFPHLLNMLQYDVYLCNSTSRRTTHCMCTREVKKYEVLHSRKKAIQVNARSSAEQQKEFQSSTSGQYSNMANKLLCLDQLHAVRKRGRSTPFDGDKNQTLYDVVCLR